MERAPHRAGERAIKLYRIRLRHKCGCISHPATRLDQKTVIAVLTMSGAPLRGVNAATALTYARSAGESKRRLAPTPGSPLVRAWFVQLTSAPASMLIIITRINGKWYNKDATGLSGARYERPAHSVGGEMKDCVGIAFVRGKCDNMKRRAGDE